MAQVDKLDSVDIKHYNTDNQAIQAQPIRIDPDRKHHESKAPAYMAQLLDNLSDEQKARSSGFAISGAHVKTPRISTVSR